MIEFSHSFAMPNQWTFSIKPVGLFVKKHKMPGLWIDPFSGCFSPAEITNDLNPKRNTTYNLDALEFLKKFENASVDGVFFDPPYSPRQLKECYDNIGLSLHDSKSSVWSAWKDEIARILKPQGVCLSFGWSSGGLGKGRGFEKTHILLINHGGHHNDTICLREFKFQTSLFEGGV
jgi:hypothetical protein